MKFVVVRLREKTLKSKYILNLAHTLAKVHSREHNLSLTWASCQVHLSRRCIEARRDFRLEANLVVNLVVRLKPLEVRGSSGVNNHAVLDGQCFFCSRLESHRFPATPIEGVSWQKTPCASWRPCTAWTKALATNAATKTPLLYRVLCRLGIMPETLQGCDRWRAPPGRHARLGLSPCWTESAANL